MFDNIDQNNIYIRRNLFLKPDYLIHSEISGNKYRKLKYNLIEAKSRNKNTLLTFGGAFSNHIAAVAAAGKLFGFKTIGIIRGEELKNEQENPTLSYALSCGMQLKFVSRDFYREKNSAPILKSLSMEFGDFYFLPEGGTNDLAIKGCEEILTDSDNDFEYICCPVGTGGTLAGLINSARPHQKILGFPALKGNLLRKEINRFAIQNNWELITDYHFGGYAKINTELISFINKFKNTHNIPLDPIYTGKMMYGIFDLIEKNFFPKDAKILAIHTGGLQGIKGMNQLLMKKNMPLIQ